MHIVRLRQLQQWRFQFDLDSNSIHFNYFVFVNEIGLIPNTIRFFKLWHKFFFKSYHKFAISIDLLKKFVKPSFNIFKSVSFDFTLSFSLFKYLFFNECGKILHKKTDYIQIWMKNGCFKALYVTSTINKANAISIKLKQSFFEAE